VLTRASRNSAVSQPELKILRTVIFWQMGCASSAPSLSHNGELKSTADSLIQEGSDLASKAKKSADDLLDAAGDAKDDALATLQGKDGI
jgi:hypothetical protein